MSKDTLEEQVDITPSSGNVFDDLGISNPEEHLAKAELARQINAIISECGLKQMDAANLLGIDQPKISAIKRGHLSGFSFERLISYLNKLDQDVKIVVKPKSRSNDHHGHLRVTMELLKNE